MPSILTAISTRKNRGTGRTKPAVRIECDGVTIYLPHAAVRGLDASQVQARLADLADARGISLPTIVVHVNRDSSLAVATGAAPDVWPEDEGPDG